MRTTAIYLMKLDLFLSRLPEEWKPSNEIDSRFRYELDVSLLSVNSLLLFDDDCDCIIHVRESEPESVRQDDENLKFP